MTLTDGDAHVTWQPGYETVALAGRTYDLDLRAAHTWAEGCVTDNGLRAQPDVVAP